MSGEALRIVVVRTKGFAGPKVMNGFAAAFCALGHKVHVLDLARLATWAAQRGAIEAALRFAPDLALGYGANAVLHCGGTHLFESFGIPSVHYFADDPFHPTTAADVTALCEMPRSVIAVWDRTYLGAFPPSARSRVFWLPLAADHFVFGVVELSDEERARFACDVAFAGNGNVTRRAKVLESLRDDRVAIYGDRRRWEEQAHGSPVLGWYRGFLSTCEELRALYNAALINLNITDPQGRASANCRVFEVLACGGFLLSDSQAGLDELFDVGREVVCYRDVSELPALVKSYLRDEVARRRIGAAGRRRVLAEHTYVHRAKSLIEQVGRIAGFRRAEVSL